MKWVLAGIAFALMVGLAAFTAGIKAQNVAVRARIAWLVQRIEALEVELGRRAILPGGSVVGEIVPGNPGRPVPTEVLLERLRVLRARVRRSSQ